MAISNIKSTFPQDIFKVWETVTDFANYNWRSDLRRTEVLNEKQFIEYTKDGYATTFSVTFTDPCKCWEFDMENTNIKGHWTGIFRQKGQETELDCTEEVTVKKFFMKPFIKSYLKKQQEQFMKDLQKALCQ